MVGSVADIRRRSCSDGANSAPPPQTDQASPAYGAAPLDLYDYARPSLPRTGRPPKHDLSTWTVTDDWPERVCVTAAEIAVFEAWFGDLFDDMFGPCR